MTTDERYNKRCNWLVQCYDENDEITSRFRIENRTEREAEKEAMADQVVRDADDWTMMELSDCPNK